MQYLINQKNRFYIFSLIYILIWTLAPTLINTSVAFDVSEGINWGSEWQWGYYKHPPFSSWMLYGFYAMFGHFGAYFLSQLCVIATLWCNYQLGKRVWSREVGLLGAVLTMSVAFYTYPTLEFNHNIAQFPIWSGLALAFYLAVTDGKWSHWMWLGVLGGVGMLTKYSVIFMLFPLSLYLLLPAQWPRLKTAKPWASLAIMLLIFAPHFYWLATHDWLTLSYAKGRGHTDSFFKAHFNWLNFLGAQLAVHAPLIIIAIFQRKAFVGLKTYRQKVATFKNATLIWYLWLAPIIFVVSLSLVFGIKLKDMWGMPMWGLSGLLVASFIATDKLHAVMPKMFKGVGVWLTVVTVLMVTYLSFGHKIRNRPSRMDWNEQALTQNALAIWAQHSKCSLDSLSGDRWLTALVAMNADNASGKFPSQVFDGSPKKTPWMTKSRLEKHGTLLLWKGKNPTKIKLLNGLSAKFDKHEGEWLIPWTKNPTATPLLVKWASYVPKNCVK